MSRGLGPQQHRLLALASRFRGEPVGYVAEHLAVSERRARKVVASLVDRALVIVVVDPSIGRRVWTPAAYDDWLRAQRKAVAIAEAAQIPGGLMRAGGVRRSAR